jgi:tetratricopeptide (TPR) repeat protein
MYQLTFWKSWLPVYQRLLAGFACLFVFFVVYVLYAYDRSPAPVIQPEFLQQRVSQQVNTGSLHIGAFEVQEPATNYLVFESVKGSLLKPNRNAAYFFAGVVAIAVILLISIITTLSRFWFFAGFGIFIVWLVSLQLSSFLIFNVSGQWAVAGVTVIYAIPVIYFYFFKTDADFLIRLAVFAGLTLLIGVLIGWGSQIKNPIGLLAVNFIPGSIFIVFLTMILVAHEILASFIWVVGQGKQQKSLRHFLIISVIYLINVFVLYADSIYLIHWDINKIYVYVLMLMTVTVGLWGFRRQSPQYETIFNPDPFATFFYAALSLVVVGSLAFFISTDNDPLLELMQRIILHCHLGFGIIFLLYIIINFISLLAANVAVYKVLYQPKVMPFFTFRIAGVIATVAFFSYTIWTTSVYRATSGYLIALADWNILNENVDEAEANLTQATLYKTYTHHSQYAMANLHYLKQQPKASREAYEKAAMSGEYVWGYLNASDLYLEMGEPLQALQTMYIAKNRFPNDGYVSLALGLIHTQLRSADSAFYYFALADRGVTSDLSQTNFLAASARFMVSVPADSLLLMTSTTREGALANTLALANHQHLTLSMPLAVPTDTVLNLYTTIRLVNQVINQVQAVDTSDLRKILTLARRPSNHFYEESLIAAIAHGYYKQGMIRDAISLVQELNYRNRKGEYNYLLALWLAQANNTEGAMAAAKEAERDGHGQALIIQAMLLLEEGRLPEAKMAWDSLQTHSNSSIAMMAKEVHEVLSSNVKDSWSDQQKLYYLTYIVPMNEQEDFSRTLASVNEDHVKARAILVRSKKYLSAEQPSDCLMFLKKLNEMEITDERLREEIRVFSLVFFTQQKQWPAVNQQREVLKDRSHHSACLYAEASLAWENKEFRTAESKFQYVVDHDPYLEDAIIDASHFFEQMDSTSLKPLSVLTEGLLARPQSVKVLKAYTLKAAKLGYAEEAQETMNKLSMLLPETEMLTFINSYPALFDQ